MRTQLTGKAPAYLAVELQGRCVKVQQSRRRHRERPELCETTVRDSRQVQCWIWSITSPLEHSVLWQVALVDSRPPRLSADLVED